MPIIEKADCGNRLLRELPNPEFMYLATRLARVGLTRKQILVTANEPIEDVYFLESGVASVIMAMPHAGPTAVGIFGREGFSGSSLLLGAKRSPHSTIMQVDGQSALKISTKELMTALEEYPALKNLLLRYIQTLLVQSAAKTAAIAHLRVEARLARCLLMCHDRIDGDYVQITHTDMAAMISAQRTRVTMTLHILEGNGIIQGSRGQIRIVDRKQLEAVAGEAYGHAEAEYRQLIGPIGEPGNHEPARNVS